jgi:tetratricopeptide (TPR) repeat protein
MKDNSKLMSTLQCLVEQPELMQSENYRDLLVHYYATAVHKKQITTEDIQSINKQNPGKEVIGLILEASENYLPAKADSPEGIKRLWIEYMVTGNLSLVADISSALGLHETEANMATIDFSSESLITNVPVHGIKGALHKEMEASKGLKKASLEHILDRVTGLAAAARNYLSRGYNFFKTNELEKAYRDFENALQLYPFYPYVFIHASNVHDARGDGDKAIEIMKRAILLAPDNPSPHKGLGRLYFLQKDYEQAIKYEKIAVAKAPDNAKYNHGLARSYQMLGDVDNAVKYFKRYLKLAPHGEHAELVKDYLASVNVSVEEDPDDLINMLKSSRYAQLEERLGSFKKKKDKGGYSMLSNAYNTLVEPEGNKYVIDRWLKYFEAWLNHDSESHFANAAIGMFYIEYAWAARGTGFSSTVLKDGRKLFDERLVTARRYLEKAYTLDTSDPIVPVGLITVSRGLGLNYLEMEKQFQRAVRVDNTLYEPYRAKLVYLMPKWHGSRSEMFDFARDTAKTAPLESLAPIVLAQAHWEMYYRTKDMSYFKNRYVYEEVKNIYLMLQERFPESTTITRRLKKMDSLAEMS